MNSIPRSDRQFERALAIDSLQVTGRRDLAMSRIAKGDTLGDDSELRRLLQNNNAGRRVFLFNDI
jgi:hypothetical protein